MFEVLGETFSGVVETILYVYVCGAYTSFIKNQLY